MSAPQTESTTAAVVEVASRVDVVLDDAAVEHNESSGRDALLLAVPTSKVHRKRRQSVGELTGLAAATTTTAKENLAKDERRPMSANEDARSITTTTSDVNSDDDAASIVHRLSQIVFEQEGKLFPDETPQRRNSVQSEAPRCLEQQQERVRRFSLRPRMLGTYESDEDSLLKVQSNESCGVAGSAVVHHLDRRPKSAAASSQLEKESSPCAGSNEALGQQHPPIIHRNSSSGYLPERGNLRALESNRKQQQQAAAAAALSVNPTTLLESPTTAARIRAESFDGPAMLNIQRSAWTLSEFDQTFNKSSAHASNSSLGSVAVLGDSSGPAKDTSLLIGPQTPDAVQETGKLVHVGDMNKLASSSNLMIMASKNAFNQSGQQQHANHLNATNPLINGVPHLAAQQAAGVVQASLLQAANLCAGKPGHHLLMPSVELEKHRRRYSATSFASSQDSFNNLKLRSKSFQTNNKGDFDHQPDADDTNVSACRQCCQLKTLSRYLPVLDWLPNYKRSQLSGDIMAGLVVATLNISISLSAAVVAETDPGTAFRASIVSTFVYAILCSSRHTSFGSWSIMSQMMLVSVKRALSDELLLSRLNIGSSLSWSPAEYERWHLNIIIMYTFLIGFVQLMGGLLNLGNILASFIPEALGSSMITATAFTMAIGQLANMCGTTNKVLWSIERNTTALWADLKNPPVDITDLFAGLFRWVKQIALLIKYYEQINTICVTISVVSVILLFFNQYFIQKWLESYFKKRIFIPFEVILVVVMICISYWLGLRTNYNVTTCGPIVIEFAAPNIPNLKLIRELWFESLATALISYSMVYVMSKQYSNKLNYECEYNQELIACGAGNLIGGLFDALPATASFSRTSAKVEAGGNTQMASLINCIVLLVLAHFLGQYVTELPVCVTSAALFYGFVRMMTSFTKVFVYWRVCKVDFAIWCFTFVAILTLDLVNGFVYGFIFSILTMLYRAQSRRCYMLGTIGSSDVYVPLDKYPLAEEVDGIKIFQFCGPIHYVCADIFERLLRQKTRVNVKQIAICIAKQKEDGKFKFDPRDMNLPTHIILDFSMISFVDTAGIHIIKKIIEDYDRVNVTILIASLASHVAAMVKSEPTLWGLYKERFYVTLTDAVHCAIRDRRLRDAEIAVAESLNV